MEKFKFGALVAFVVKGTPEITVDLGTYNTLERAVMACNLHRESELFSYVFDYYHGLGIDHQISTYVLQQVTVE